MRFITVKDTEFNGFWTRFVNENTNATWQYLPEWLKIEKFYSMKYIKDDLSFILANDDELLCICPLLLQVYENRHSFSWSDNNGYLLAPIIKTLPNNVLRKRIEKKCFKKIDELAKQNDVDKVMLRLDPLSELYAHNVLVEYGYLDASINTYVINLANSPEKIWANLRKSFKSLINKGKRKFSIEIVDYKNPDFEIHNIYKELHHKAAGRITRSKETWDLQFDMLTEDHAILIGLKDHDRFVAFSYFFHHNKNAYFGSSSNDPDCSTDVPVGHSMIWSAIEYYQKRGFNFLETGTQRFGPLFFDHPSPKDISISYFKRGFGGQIISYYRGIKYFNKEIMKQDLEDNVIKLVKGYGIE